VSADTVRPNTVRAVVCDHYGPIEKLRLGTLPRAEIGPDEVRIDIAAVGLNFPDLLLIDGSYQYKAAFPFAIGLEAAGVISELGSAVTDFEIGERVMTHPWRGCLAAEIAAPAALTFAVPASMSMEIAAGFALAHGTNYHGLVDRGRLQAGDTLLVLGAGGGVGLSAVALGKALGATVIAAAK
jgi:NADPH2:quinone reductase